MSLSKFFTKYRKRILVTAVVAGTVSGGVYRDDIAKALQTALAVEAILKAPEPALEEILTVGPLLPEDKAQ